MKEMVGGCCVCSDERGWPENPLVYCDGNGCTVAVHQACYGIVTVPTGPWFCGKCENPETKGNVRCELCPSKSGALKRSDTGRWAHVVCALYIPEVRFGNVTSMEPIVLRLIPPERYSKTCYICQERGKTHRASTGACMPCNRSGCKQQFHVTCAQSLGLLCEEAGNYLDNVKYCGYCQHHYSKLARRKSSHSSSSGSSKGTSNPAITPSDSTQPMDNSDKGARKSSPGRRSSLRSKNNTPAPSPQHSGSDQHRQKGGGSSPKTTPPATSPGKKTQESPGVISSVASATANIAAGVSPALTTSVVQSPTATKPSFQESVFTNAEESKHTKKRKVVMVPGALAPAAEYTPQYHAPANDHGRMWKNPSPPPADVPMESVDKMINKKTKIDEGSANSYSNPAHPLPPSSQRPTPQPSPRYLPSAMPGPSGSTQASNMRSPSQPQAAVEQRVSQHSPHASHALPGPGRTTWSGLNVCYEMQDPNKTGGTPAPASKDASTSVGPPIRSKKRAAMATSVVTMTSASSPKIHTPLANWMRPQQETYSYKESIKQSPPASPVSEQLLKPKAEIKNCPVSTAPHMLGNELNPESVAATRLQEQLNAASMLYLPPLINKASSSHSAGGTTSDAQSLEQLLERQWEQGSQFMMEQAQHFDIASLLSCLHQLRTDNAHLEEHVSNLVQRRDHLLGVNARLAIPLTQQPSSSGQPGGEPSRCPRENRSLKREPSGPARNETVTAERADQDGQKDSEKKTEGGFFH